MSKLILTGYNGREFRLNVTQFRSPMSSQINTVQTRTMVQHFPIRCGQPDIQFTCQFENQDLKHRFQNFVRDHQTRARDITDNWGGHVNLWWPQRNIENWTGYITGFKVIERRFDYAPVVVFGVDLVNSMMSERTTISSHGPGFNSVYGPQIPAYDEIIEPIARAAVAVMPWITDFRRYISAERVT
jgi:hypothetical protein